MSGIPQHNGVLERRNRALLEMVRSMMSYATLLISFWGYALEIASYILNLVPSKNIPKILHELWTGHKLSLSHVRVWVTPAHILDKGIDKLKPRSEVRFFIIFPRGTKGGLFIIPRIRTFLLQVAYSIWKMTIYQITEVAVKSFFKKSRMEG